MLRKDSGFVDSQPPKASSNKPDLVSRSHSATTTRRKHKRTTTDTMPSSKAVAVEPKRPASESRSRPSRQQSSASSGNSTSRSKGRGHGSKPSSQRTSFTIVDPSRPTRHYRMQSTQSVPTGNGQDIDDVLALHFRSCSLFTNPSYHTHSSLPSPSLSHGDSGVYPGVAARFSSDEMRTVQEAVPPEHSEEDIATSKKTNTTMHWTSPCTRKRDYERIDRANSGLRGIFRKVVPRCVSGPQEKFYEKDRSDAGSVRRYRLDDIDNPVQEKSNLRRETSRVGRPMTARPKTSWGCF